jgi:hypothetical protein
MSIFKDKGFRSRGSIPDCKFAPAGKKIIILKITEYEKIYNTFIVGSYFELSK